MRAEFLVLVGALSLFQTGTLHSEERLIEEIIVTAQRVEENAQRVPISISAFDDVAIRERQIVGILDIQLNAPNVSATESNFGSRQLAIRGISTMIEVQGRAQDTVSFHVNQVPLGSQPLTEFYDLERIEVLRGPQGTLYGRNSTAGAVNATTRRPSFDGFDGSIDVEAGNYGLLRIKGAAEVTFSENFAVRVAGYTLDRDGYIDNVANGQVPGVDDDLDGRDVYSFRVTPEWRMSDRTTLWLVYEHTKEDDDRVRISNQVCRTHPYPTLGCDPDAFGLEAPNPSANGIARASSSNGLYPLGAADAQTGLSFEFPRPELDIRDQHTDLEPVFEYESNLWTAGFDHSFDNMQLSVLGSYQDIEYVSLQDWFMDVGYRLNPTDFNPSGEWPTSRASRDPEDAFGGPCPLYDGTGGVFGGCVLDVNPTRSNYLDQVAYKRKDWTVEAKLSTDLESPLNGLLGAQYIHSEGDSSYHVLSNEIDAFSVYGIPSLGVGPLYSGMDAFLGESELESYSAFGELYWRFSNAVKITLGLRYTNDETRSEAVSALVQSFALPGDTGDPPGWIRSALGSWLGPTGPDETALALTDYYGLTDRALTAANPGELITTLQMVPPIPTLGEAKGAFDIPDTYSTSGFTGRLGADWSISPDLLMYGFFSRGRGPGGFTVSFQGQNAGEFDDEKVNVFEIGAKSLLFDGSLRLNVAAFYSALNDLHVSSRGSWTTSPVEIFNMDAEAWGIELESLWRPTENVAVDLTYGWLDTSIDDFQSQDIVDLTQGDPDLVLLRNYITGGENYVAPREDVLPLVPQAISFGVADPAVTYPDGTPVWFNRAFLQAAGVDVSDGVPADLDGNQLPTSPEHSLRLGLAYTWFWPSVSLTARWDYYWQSKSYARVFNRPGDRIDSWDQHNASLSFMSADERWALTAWIRNATDEDNVTDHYLHGNEGAGPYRNYFLTEPRVYGLTMRYSFAEASG